MNLYLLIRKTFVRKTFKESKIVSTGLVQDNVALMLLIVMMMLLRGEFFLCYVTCAQN